MILNCLILLGIVSSGIFSKRRKKEGSLFCRYFSSINIHQRVEFQMATCEYLLIGDWRFLKDHEG